MIEPMRFLLAGEVQKCHPLISTLENGETNVAYRDYPCLNITLPCCLPAFITPLSLPPPLSPHGPLRVGLYDA